MSNFFEKKYYKVYFGIFLFAIPALILYWGVLNPLQAPIRPRPPSDFLLYLYELVTNDNVLGILFQCLTSGYIVWAILYTDHTLKERRNIFLALIQLADKEEWFTAEMKRTYNSIGTYVICVFTAILLIVTPWKLIGNPLPSTFESQFYTTFSIFSFVLGCGASAVFLIGHFFVRFTRKPLDFSIFQYPYSQFKDVVQIHLKFSWITAGGLFLASCMTFFYWKFQLCTIIWYSIGILSLVYFIFIPRIAFHKVLKDKKAAELKEISRKMETYYQLLKQDYNKKDFKSLKNYHETSEIVSKLHEWPLDLKSMLYSGLSILPQILFLIKTLLLKPS